MPRPQPNGAAPSWARVACYLAVVACLCVLTYGVVFQPAGQIPVGSVVMLGSVAFLAVAGLTGPTVASRLLDRLPGIGSGKKR